MLEQAGELEVQSGELESYKKMSESLKNKIRELSSKDGDSKDFMDSFEEGKLGLPSVRLCACVWRFMCG